MSTWKTAWEKIQDPDASKWETVSSVMMAIGMTIPTLTAAYNLLTKSINAENLILKILTIT
jgi:hypothetical protein